ncbi:hypothetical protein C8A01DRAFT_15883 [Parachaetomium inaequale]|uniref:Uncharacterized protein n=1 Tax=Parachaetomium inaequale TaxID=2588326 RepID=A0AAN6PHN3_9PEZI|nr:hypothetical protein C8A01DRAFT_15883 [Parachaetomium inaequale]
MCIWSYSHHHHLPPCTQPIEMVVNYQYCDFASTDPVTGVTQPCEQAFFGDDAALMNQVDYNDPCATGGCLLSPDCESGGCRLAQLGGRWACCQCGGRANEHRWCQHRMRTSPDTFCYHTCCDGCRADYAAPPHSHSANGGGSSTAGSSSGSSSSGRRGRR